MWSSLLRMGSQVCKQICNRQGDSGDAADKASLARTRSDRTLPNQADASEESSLMADPEAQAGGHLSFGHEEEEEQVEPQPSSAEADKNTPPPIVCEAVRFGAGDCVEVYSMTYNAWCPGVIYEAAPSQVIALYQVPCGNIESSISTKVLAADSADLRVPSDDGPWLHAPVDIFSVSRQVWCEGEVIELRGGTATVAYRYPDDPLEVADVDPTRAVSDVGSTLDSAPQAGAQGRPIYRQRKEVPLGDDSLALPGADSAWKNAKEKEQLTVGCRVEVYDGAVWCPGVIEAVNDGMAEIAICHPDLKPGDPPSYEVLPLYSPDIRLPVEPVFAAGDKVDVFSESRDAWLPSEVKEVQNGHVTVIFQYPDVPEQMFEKVLPVVHAYLRVSEC
eukprot:TRINITY_DN42876_c0_g1_i1.p1 TRINITY_DN42876_c0_g1~~TRINITY_DN42876_c0_g1_i1.p1  ORF type:complete len:389 (+),score=80.88 TRINITY_DN42876_c0_g1_i1:76-1242(+)